MSIERARKARVRAQSSSSATKRRLGQIDHPRCTSPSRCSMWQRVATIDLDLAAEKLHPLHREQARLGAARPTISTFRRIFCVARGATLKLDENEAIEFAGFAEAVGAAEHTHDFRGGGYARHRQLSHRLAHSMPIR